MINFKINISKIHWLTPEELERKGLDHWTPDLDQNRNIITGVDGKKTHDFQISYIEANANHPHYVYTNEYLKLIQSKEFEPFRRESKYYKERVELSRKYGNTINKMPEEIQNKIIQIDSEIEKATQEQEKLFKNPKFNYITKKIKSFTVSNQIRMDQENIFAHDETVLAHELMHSIGGYEDEYLDPKHTSPNLMGAYGGGNTCVLNKRQIELFIKYHKIVN